MDERLNREVPGTRNCRTESPQREGAHSGIRLPLHRSALSARNLTELITSFNSLFTMAGDGHPNGLTTNSSLNTTSTPSPVPNMSTALIAAQIKVAEARRARIKQEDQVIAASITELGALKELAEAGGEAFVSPELLRASQGTTGDATPAPVIKPQVASQSRIIYSSEIKLRGTAGEFENISFYSIPEKMVQDMTVFHAIPIDQLTHEAILSYNNQTRSYPKTITNKGDLNSATSIDWDFSKEQYLEYSLCLEGLDKMLECMERAGFLTGDPRDVDRVYREHDDVL